MSLDPNLDRGELEAHLRLETLLADLSSGFINVPSDDVDRAIEAAQSRVCETLGLDVSVVWQWPPLDPERWTATHIYRRFEGPPPPEPMLAHEHVPWSLSLVRAGTPLVVASTDAVPQEAARDKMTWDHFGVKATFGFPLSVGGSPPFGAVSFDSTEEGRTWSDAIVARLRLVAQAFANALARKRSDQALREGAFRLAEGAGLAGLGFYEVDNGVTVSYFDERARTIFGIPADLHQGASILEFWLARVHADDRPAVVGARRQMAAGECDRVTVEYRYLHPATGERWIHHLARVTLRGAQDVEIRTLGVVRDITDRRLVEERLRTSLAELADLKDRLQAESDCLKAEIVAVQGQRAIVGQGAAIARVLRLVEQVAPTGAPVLVQGETGVGKELVAQTIHRLSPRGHRVMVKVNCAALPTGLIESELFGREKGAYTGALTSQVGRFEVAHGSTLFLDEVGELSLEVQAKLLRVLEDGQFERLGSSRAVKVDVRLIAATNRNLTEAVREGRFREDLYYRINVFPIHVPPLRDRVEDIPQLVWTLLEECSVRMGKRITKVSRSAMEALTRRPWPGNVRELRNVIEYAAIMTQGDTLAVPAFEEAAPAAASPQTLVDAERAHILRTLDATGWHIKGPGGAAVLLGTHPATLYSRMRKLGLWPRPRGDRQTP